MNEETKTAIPETKQPVVPVKPVAPVKPEAKAQTPPPAAPVPTQQPAEKAISPLAAFSALVDKAPKEHLPTMMVKLANKCIAEKVFANPRAMALAIEGAVRVK